MRSQTGSCLTNIIDALIVIHAFPTQCCAVSAITIGDTAIDAGVSRQCVVIVTMCDLASSRAAIKCIASRDDAGVARLTVYATMLKTVWLADIVVGMKSIVTTRQRTSSGWATRHAIAYLA